MDSVSLGGSYFCSRLNSPQLKSRGPIYLCSLAPPTCALTCAYFMLMSRCSGSWGARRAARGWAGWSSAGSSGSPAGGFSPGDAVQTRLTADPRNTNGSLFKSQLEKAFSLITFVFYPNLSRWVSCEGGNLHTTLICCLLHKKSEEMMWKWEIQK